MQDHHSNLEESGFVILTDTTVESKPCQRRRNPVWRRANRGSKRNRKIKRRRQGAPGPQFEDVEIQRVETEPVIEEAAPPTPTVDVRTYFPETWLWDLHFVGESGALTLTEELPHTVTEWIGTGFCSNVNSGLGISPSTAIKGFQPFFLSLTLPYSVVRGETLKLPVTVFNYLTECLVVQLSIASSTDYEVPGSSTADWCVCGQESVTHYYKLKPLTLGEIDIDVSAISIDNNGACGNNVFMSNQIGVRDAVSRELLVEAEGREEEYTRTSFMCPSPTQNVQETLALDVPGDYVEGTPRAILSAIGDIMGPSLQGLESLLRMPVGCGEQTMITFVPNIYVLQYLTPTGQLTPDLRQKIMGYLTTGYQRELNYRHNDGSYSAFGTSDNSGSTWLTAFVVKSFAQAKQYIDIDDENLIVSIKWFMNNQMENGCFPKIGRIIHKDMKGGLDGGSNDAGLTAFVLIALLESMPHISVPGMDSAIQSGFDCLSSHTVTDTYSLSLIAYAHALHGGPMTAEKLRIRNMLRQKSVNEGGLLHWGQTSEPPQNIGEGWCTTPIYKPKSTDVEMTAYMLLSLLQSQGNEAIPSGLPIVKWLTSQRNAYGGFSSTQDTVLALQGLAKYATMTFSEGSNLTVTMRMNEGERHNFQVGDDNRLLLQQYSVSLPNSVNVQARGTGCVLVQAVVRYNVANISTSDPGFTLQSTVMRADDCKKRNLKVCAKYEGSDGASNMAVITVKMVSGWIPIKDSVKNLMNEAGLGLKRYELDMNLVNFYFDELTEMPACLTFQVEQDIEVEHAKPGYVKVFDYYKNELSVTKPYEIGQICGTKEELPFVSPEEFDRMHDRDASEIEQVRVPVRHPHHENDGRQPTPCENGGTPESGECSCAEGYFGQRCECEGFPVDERACIMVGSSEVCEGHGQCDCGNCMCGPTPSGPRFTGRYCECNDYSCPYSENQICGGPTRGQCSCGICRCKPGWTGEACDCTESIVSCTTTGGHVCNNQGRCMCGRCVCEGLYRGSTCEEHPEIIEPVIIPENVAPSGMECPSCLESEPSDFITKFCAADKAYRALVRNNARYPVKILHNYRLRNRPSVMKLTKINMADGCTCSPLTAQNRGRKLMILVKDEEVVPQQGTRDKASLNLDRHSTVLLLPRVKKQAQAIERKMRNKVKRNQC